tara:strand:+ start:27226 stop:27990 length:765 start_codon:yes stop_codon:yes gene_type:complete
MLEFFERLTISADEASSSSKSRPLPVSTTPVFYTENDELSWRLLLLYCDYYALKLPVPTARNPRISEISRFFDHIANDVQDANDNSYWPIRINHHVNQLESAFLHKMEKHWIFRLGILIQDWLIDPNSNRLRIEIREKFTSQFQAWPEILKSCSFQETTIDNALCRAYAFMIVQCLFKNPIKATIKKTMGTLFATLNNVDFCNPNSCEELYGVSLALKPTSSSCLTINFDRDVTPSAEQKQTNGAEKLYLQKRL